MLRALLPTIALLVLPAPAGAQTIATVGGHAEITKEQFDHWLQIAARASREGPVPPTGTPRWRDLSDQVMQLLLQNQWVEGEAALRGIAVTDARVDRAFRAQRRMSFPKPGDFRRFLRTSGFTVGDIRFRVRLEQLSNELRQAVVRGLPRPTPVEVRHFYATNRPSFWQPERRDVELIRAPTETVARAVRRSVAAGDSFRRAARRLGLRARRLTTAGRRFFEDRLRPAVFAARAGRVVGPVHTRYGWTVFRVVHVRRGRTRSLAESARVIRTIITSERQQLALDAFIEDYQRRWRSMTTCQVRYATADCGRVTRP